MYGFSDSSELHSLLGAELLQICIGRNEVILNFFPDNTKITISSIDAFFRDNINILDGVFVNEGYNRNIIGDKISGITVQDRQHLLIEFSGGLNLLLTDDSEQYEAVHISASNCDIVA
jgi:hypothetical protein